MKQLTEHLSSLISVNEDRYEGYLAAMGETQDKDLQELFKRMANEANTFCRELKELAASCAINPNITSLSSGRLYRVWMDIKSALVGKEKRSILSCCEYGEDVAYEMYDKAMKEIEDHSVNGKLILHRDAFHVNRTRLKKLRDEIK